MEPLSTFSPGLFRGQVVLVTGAAMGIGARLAECFAAHGATLAVHDRTLADADRRATELRNGGAEALAFAGDLSERGAAERLFDEVLRDCGRINCLVNNAGRSWAVSTADIDEARTTELIELNMTAVLRLSRRMALHRKEQGGGGAIVQISSTAGILGFRNRAVYSATKHAVIGLTKTLALDHAADGLRINAVLPHVIETPMFRTVASAQDASTWSAAIPMGRFGTPDDVAGVVLFLCSPAAAYLTGGSYVVDGGSMAGQ